MTTIAIVQVSSSTNKRENLEKALDLVRQAHERGADRIVFPEFLMAEELAAIAEPVDGPFMTRVKQCAKATGVAVLATIYETCAVANRVYDTAVWVDATGTTTSVYRKLHLYDAFGFKESAKFHPGDDIAELVQAGESQIGMMICYDLRFPEMARMLALLGASILVAPSGWVRGDLKLEHWQTMIKARALENGCYVVAPDQVGNIYIGHSMVVDPLGRIIAELGEQEGLELVDLDPTLVTAVREKLPLLRNRRGDVYARHLSS
jgi:predicted amidohydrolase